MNSFKGLDLVGRMPQKLWAEVHNIVQEAVKPLLFGIFLTSKIDLTQARYPFGFFINTSIFLSHKCTYESVTFIFTKQYSSLLHPHHLPYFIHSYNLWILLALTLSVTPLVQVTIVVLQSLSLVQIFVTPWTAGRQASLAFTVSRVCSNACLLSRLYHPTISSSVIPFSSCL